MAGFAKVSEWNEHCEEPGPSASPSAEGVAGGFRHWPHESALLKRVEDIKLSDCRDMVLVETGTEWRLRQMSELYPDYCWKYAESSVLAYYHYCMAASGDGPVAPSKRPTASLPVFYATLPYEFSPYDFSIQPKCLDKACKQLQEQMQTFYDTHDSPTFSKKELFIGMACAVNSHGEWRRGKILEYSNAADALIDVVDYGTENLVKTSQIRPLMKEFGRLPPLAMRCRMKDVCINDLTAAKVSAFHELLADCGGLVRVELADVSSIPYRVNLYHPTIEGRNLGSLFYRREVHPEREAARQRRWQARLARINGDDIEDDEDYGSDFEDEPEELPHVKCLERLEKPIGASRLFVCHVENSRFVYLHSEYHNQAIQTIENQLMDQWSALLPFPRGTISTYTACAYLEMNGKIEHVYRAIVANVNNGEVEIRAADHGWRKQLPIECCYSGRLRILNKQFADAPFMYVCRFASSMEHYPHFSETAILRRVMPQGSAVNVRCEKTKGTAPYKADFINDKGENIWELVEKIKADEHVVHPCFDLVHYDDKRVRLLSFHVPDGYREELEIFTPFAKGKMQLTNFLHVSNC